MDQYELVRTAHRVYGQNISELSRMTGHSRNTIKKAIRGEPWGYKEREHQPFPVLEPYLETIDAWIEGDKDQLKKQRHTARRVRWRRSGAYFFRAHNTRRSDRHQGYSVWHMRQRLFPRLALLEIEIRESSKTGAADWFQEIPSTS